MDLASHRYGRYGVPYGTGNCTECACIAKVAFFSIFQFFYNLHDLPQKKNNYMHLPQKKIIQFFLIIYMTYREKKITRIYREKELHNLLIFLYTSYIFHLKSQ